MIRLHYSNRLENLIAPLADAIAAAQRERPLDRVTIVVPSRVIENFVRHRVSETIGIAANLDFPFLRRFLAGVLEKADPRLRILDVQELELVLFESLRVAMRERSREWSVPIAYIEQGEPAEKEKERRTFHLARQLALLFREYSIARGTMLRNWTRPDYAASEQLSETERWQQQLWKSIFGPNSCLRGEWKADDPETDWRLLPDAFETIAASRLKVALPRVAHVFGLAYAGPAYLRIFSQIGKFIDLNIYALNPCREFWEDVEHLPRAERESWTRRHSKVGDLEHSTDPFGLEAASDTPALRLWARPGREFIRMLNEATECDFDAHFTAPNPGRATRARESAGRYSESGSRTPTRRVRFSRRRRKHPVSRLPRSCARNRNSRKRNLVDAGKRYPWSRRAAISSDRRDRAGRALPGLPATHRERVLTIASIADECGRSRIGQ